MQPVLPFGRCLSIAEGGSLMRKSYHHRLAIMVAAVLALSDRGWTGPRRGQRNSANRPWLQARHRSDQSRRRRASAVAIKRGHQYPDARGVALGVNDTRIETTVDWRNAEHAAAGDDDVGRLKRASESQNAAGGPPGTTTAGSAPGSNSAGSDRRSTSAKTTGSATSGEPPPSGPIGSVGETIPAKFSKRNDILDRTPIMALPLPLSDQQRRADLRCGDGGEVTAGCRR